MTAAAPDKMLEYAGRITGTRLGCRTLRGRGVLGLPGHELRRRVASHDRLRHRRTLPQSCRRGHGQGQAVEEPETQTVARLASLRPGRCGARPGASPSVARTSPDRARRRSAQAASGVHRSSRTGARRLLQERSPAHTEKHPVGDACSDRGALQAVPRLRERVATSQSRPSARRRLTYSRFGQLEVNMRDLVEADQNLIATLNGRVPKQGARRG